MFNPDDLLSFIVISEEKNITRAAHRRGLSQPALTQALRRLETEFGADLCFRDSRGVKLTKAGEALLDEARTLIESWQSLKERAKALKSEPFGSVTIGCHVSVAQYSLPLFLPSLRRDHPGIEVRLTHAHSREMTRAVVEREVDLGIVINPSAFPNLIIRPLAKDSVSFWTAKGSLEHQMIICDPQLHQTQSLLRKCKRKGWDRWPRIESSSLEVVRQLVTARLGIGILPERVARAIPQLLLQKVPESPEFEDEICLIYRSEVRKSPVLRAVMESIHQGFQVA